MNVNSNCGTLLAGLKRIDSYAVNVWNSAVYTSEEKRSVQHFINRNLLVIYSRINALYDSTRPFRAERDIRLINSKKEKERDDIFARIVNVLFNVSRVMFVKNVKYITSSWKRINVFYNNF